MPATPLMQRRHFELIANTIRVELHGHSREQAAQAFARVLRATNINFDRERFLAACLEDAR